MKHTCLIVAFSVLSINLSAQRPYLKGRVLEKSSREALLGATVYLTDISDSSVIKGTVTDSIGRFQLDNILKGSYRLYTEFLGYMPQHIEILMDSNVNIGTIFLEPSDYLLDRVTIKGKKSKLINTLDKQIYNVGEDLFSTSNSVSQILQNIPAVNVEINGAITLRNTSNITFFINGRPSAMLRRNAAAYLEQLPANSIERIEIITNPSAKYRPDGVGGIINIVLKKESGQGLNGLININFGTEQRANGGLNLQYGDDAFNLYGSYSTRHSGGTFLFEDKRVYKGPDHQVKKNYFEKGNSNIDAWSHTFVVGGSYEINDYNSVETTGTYFFQNSFHNGLSEISSKDAQGNPGFIFDNLQTNDEFEGEAEASFAWEHAFKNNEDHSLAFEFSYSAFNESEHLSFEQRYLIPDSYTELTKSLVQKYGNQKEIILDYSLPVTEEIEFEVGYAGEYIFENIQYTNVTLSWFQFNQKVHAIYALFTQSFDKLSYKAGLRVEQAYVKSHLLMPADSLIPVDYFKIFPTLHLGYELDDKKRLMLSYSKRINRPEGDELNPNPEFSDPRNAEAGNPALKPEQVHSLELGFQATGKKITFKNTPLLSS